MYLGHRAIGRIDLQFENICHHLQINWQAIPRYERPEGMRFNFMYSLQLLEPLLLYLLLIETKSTE